MALANYLYKGKGFEIKCLYLQDYMFYHLGQYIKMRLRNLKYCVLLAVAAVFAASCSDDEDDAVSYPSLSGLTFNCPVFVAPEQVVTFTPDGIEHPEGKGIGYYWKVSPSKPEADTTRLENGLNPDTGKESDGSFVHKFSDTLATYDVTCYAFAEGYNGDAYTVSVAVVKGGLDQSITGTGIRKTDNHISIDGTDYYYTAIAGLDWFRNNLSSMGKGSALLGEEVTSDVFGRYYSYEEAMTACPEGWRLPSEADWNSLCSAVGAEVSAEYSTIKGVAAKLFANASFNGEPMIQYWPSVGEITNSSKLSLIPSGFANLGTKDAAGKYPSAAFDGLYDYVAVWTSDSVDGEEGMAYYRYMVTDQPDFYVGKGDMKSFGASVRCVRDSQ